MATVAFSGPPTSEGSWAEIGEIGGRPAALSADGGELLVALHTNLVKASTDGGKTWLLRVAAS